MNISLKALNNLTFDELIEELLARNIPRFRAEQIFKWVHQKGVSDIDEMQNIPKSLKEQLTNEFRLLKGSIVDKRVSEIDGTIKYLISLDDGNIVESVLMRYQHGISACISSQVGCRMACSFCASTIGGLIRNLTAGEIEMQLLLMQRDVNERISNIVMMGSGEPLDNFDNVVGFLDIVNDKNGLNIGYRHLTISTCGIVPNIYRLADMKLPITLALSLHGPNDEIRSNIMPVSKKYAVKDVIDACKYYVKQTKRRITFEYALIKGVNDSEAHARQLSVLLRGGLFHVNIIPVNKVSEAGFEKPAAKSIENFKSILLKSGIETTQRREMGADINAACGQLRKSYIEKSDIN